MTAPPLRPPATIVFVCGVCGSGKTSVGKELARALGDGAKFLDADDLHPPANLAKLRAATPLSDEDRAPWLDAVADAAVVEAAAAAGTVVVACSALKRAYRDALRRRVAERTGPAGSAAALWFVLLAPDEPVLQQRLAANPRPADHALPDPLRLLPSQLATLERGADDEAEWAAVIEGEAALAPPDEQARDLARRIGLSPPSSRGAGEQAD